MPTFSGKISRCFHRLIFAHLIRGSEGLGSQESWKSAEEDHIQRRPLLIQQLDAAFLALRGGRLSEWRHDRQRQQLGSARRHGRATSGTTWKYKTPSGSC